MALPKSWAQVLTLMEEDRKLKDECFANLSDFDRDRLRAASTTTQRGVNLGLLSGFAFATFLLWRKTRIELADIRNYHSTGPIHVRYADGRERKCSPTDLSPPISAALLIYPRVFEPFARS